jgi:hypothetical protein
MISPELVEKAPMPGQRNAALAHTMDQPTSRRYVLLRLVKCGPCGLGLNGNRPQSVCKNPRSSTRQAKGPLP